MIRFAEEKDIPSIMRFINDYWRENHILSRDRTLFEFQHKWETEISFVLSEKDNKIIGILGYIPYGKHNRDVTLAIWKVVKNKEPFQGLKLLSFLRKNGNIRSVSSPGINPEVTIPIYNLLGLETGKLKQWYRLRLIHDYKIAKVSKYDIPLVKTDRKVNIQELNDFSELENNFFIDGCLKKQNQLEKSKYYLKRRYFDHPIFSYIKYAISFEDEKLIVVLRLQKYKESSILRVIDCIGDLDLFSSFTSKIDELLDKYNCEYADCYETGVDDEIYKDAGWLLVSESGNIMPDYFAPFEQRNIDIYYMSEIKNVVLFKGDGDMDRPN